MARDDPQINIRLPATLKERLESEAVANSRSTTAEIVARLEQSFLGPKHPPNVVVRLEAFPYGTPPIEVSVGTFLRDLSTTLKGSVESIRQAERLERLQERTEAAKSDSLEPTAENGPADAEAADAASKEYAEMRLRKNMQRRARAPAPPPAADTESDK
jgi:molybdopterin converting factor small subunit